MSLTVNSWQLLSPNCMNGAHKEAACLSALNRKEAPSKAERTKPLGYSRKLCTAPSIYIAGGCESRFLCTGGCGNILLDDICQRKTHSSLVKIIPKLQPLNHVILLPPEGGSIERWEWLPAADLIMSDFLCFSFLACYLR